MKTKRFLQAAALIALGLCLTLIARPSSVFAFDPPWPPGIPWATTTPWPTAHPLSVGEPWSIPAPSYNYAPPPPPPAPPPPPSVAGPPPAPPPAYVPPPPTAPPPPASFAAGTTMGDAMEPTNTWAPLAAGSSVWYRIGQTGAHMDVSLDADPAGNVSMAIYAPNGSDKPIGHGSPMKSDPSRLLWSGGHWEGGGSWYALIRNGNPYPIQYRIAVAGKNINVKSCESYWEFIGPNLVYWRTCQ